MNVLVCQKRLFLSLSLHLFFVLSSAVQIAKRSKSRDCLEWGAPLTFLSKPHERPDETAPTRERGGLEVNR